MPSITEGRGEPILNPVTGAPHRVRIDMVDGFEYSLAEIGRGWTKTARPIKLELNDSYAQFAEIHLVKLASCASDMTDAALEAVLRRDRES